jgi:hypothetical protein
MKTLLLILVTASSAFGQAPTTVKGHTMGESVSEFYAKAGYPHLLEDCQAVRGDKKAAKKLKINFQMCQAVLASESGAVVYANDPKFGELGKATIVNGKLAIVELELPGEFNDILAQLTEKYGKPKAVGTRTLQNGFGARFEVGNASWLMPDETTISAVEAMASVSLRMTFVTFTSGEEVAKIKAQQQREPNPFN